jgi:hypothetical protein
MITFLYRGLDVDCESEKVVVVQPSDDPEMTRHPLVCSIQLVLSHELCTKWLEDWEEHHLSCLK